MLPFDKLELDDLELYNHRGRWRARHWGDDNGSIDLLGAEALIERFSQDLAAAFPNAEPAAVFWAEWGPFEELASDRPPAGYCGELGPLALAALERLGPPSDEDLPRVANWVFRRGEPRDGALLLLGRSLEPQASFSLLAAAINASSGGHARQTLDELQGSLAGESINALLLAALPTLRANPAALSVHRPSAAWVALINVLIEGAALDDALDPASLPSKPRGL